MSKQFWPHWTIGAALAASLTLVGCAPSTGAATGPQRIVVKGTEFRFEPASIEMRVGQPVQLVFENHGQIPHDIAFPKLHAEMHEAMGQKEADDHGMGEADHDAGDIQVHADAQPGKSETIEFTPTEPGTYDFDCTIAGHKEGGMVGKLTVTK